MDDEDGLPAEPVRRKAAATATINMSKKDGTSIKKVSAILRKKHESLTQDDRRVLEENAKLVQEYHKRRERRIVWESRKTEQEDTKDDLQAKSHQLAQAIHDSEFLVVYTGAGISTAASIPDYRGPNGIWTLLQKGQDIGNHDLSAAEPTVTHMALSKLYRRGSVRHVVSQNCDGLHLRSGLPKSAMSEVHGNMYIEVCRHCVPAREYVRTFDVTERTSTYKHTTGRRCYKCGEPLIDTIVHFGERGRLRWPLNWQGACQAANACDTILCLGSSLKVLKKYPWLWQMDRPPKKRPQLYIINLQWTPKDKDATLKINGKCDEVMAEVMKALGYKLPQYSRANDPIFTLATSIHTAEAATISRPILVPPLDVMEDTKDQFGTDVRWMDGEHNGQGGSSDKEKDVRWKEEDGSSEDKVKVEEDVRWKEEGGSSGDNKAKVEEDVRWKKEEEEDVRCKKEEEEGEDMDKDDRKKRKIERVDKLEVKEKCKNDIKPVNGLSTNWLCHLKQNNHVDNPLKAESSSHNNKLYNHYNNDIEDDNLFPEVKEEETKQDRLSDTEEIARKIMKMSNGLNLPTGLSQLYRALTANIIPPRLRDVGESHSRSIDEYEVKSEGPESDEVKSEGPESDEVKSEGPESDEVKSEGPESDEVMSEGPDTDADFEASDPEEEAWQEEQIEEDWQHHSPNHNDAERDNISLKSMASCSSSSESERADDCQGEFLEGEECQTEGSRDCDCNVGCSQMDDFHRPNSRTEDFENEDSLPENCQMEDSQEEYHIGDRERSDYGVDNQTEDFQREESQTEDCHTEDSQTGEYFTEDMDRAESEAAECPTEGYHEEENHPDDYPIDDCETTEGEMEENQAEDYMIESSNAGDDQAEDCQEDDYLEDNNMGDCETTDYQTEEYLVDNWQTDDFVTENSHPDECEMSEDCCHVEDPQEEESREEEYLLEENAMVDRETTDDHTEDYNVEDYQAEEYVMEDSSDPTEGSPTENEQTDEGQVEFEVDNSDATLALQSQQVDEASNSPVDYQNLDYSTSNFSIAQQGQRLLKQDEYYGTGLCIRSFVSCPKPPGESDDGTMSELQEIENPAELEIDNSTEVEIDSDLVLSPGCEDEESSLPCHTQSSIVINPCNKSDSELLQCEGEGKVHLCDNCDRDTNCEKCFRSSEGLATQDIHESRTITENHVSKNVLGNLENAKVHDLEVTAKILNSSLPLGSVGNIMCLGSSDDPSKAAQVDYMLHQLSQLNQGLGHSSSGDGSFVLRTQVIDGVIRTASMDSLAKDKSQENKIPIEPDRFVCGVPSLDDLAKLSVPYLKLQKALIPVANNSILHTENSLLDATPQAHSNSHNHKSTGSKFPSSINTSEQEELKSIWYQSFCGSNSESSLGALAVMMGVKESELSNELSRNVGYIRPHGNHVNVVPQNSSSVILKNICAEAMSDSAARQKGATKKKLKVCDNEDVKYIWFWGFDSNIEQKEKETKQEEEQLGEEEDELPTRRVTRSHTRASGESQPYAPADPDPDVLICHCGGKNPELCRLASLRPARTKCDEDVQKARDIISRRRTYNYRKYEPVFEKKLECLTYERTKAKRKSKFESGNNNDVDNDEEKQEQENSEVKEEDKISDGEDVKERDEKKVTPSWYGKGLRKGIKKKNKP